MGLTGARFRAPPPRVDPAAVARRSEDPRTAPRSRAALVEDAVRELLRRS